MMGHLRVLLVSSDLGGGTGTHVESLVWELNNLGVKLRVLCQGVAGVTLPPDVHMELCPRKGWWDRYPLAQVRRCRQLHSEIRRWKPQVVHSYFFWPVMYGRFLRSMGAISCLVENREDQGFNLGRPEIQMLRMTRRIPDRVICVSQGVADTCREMEGLSSEQIRVIRNGVRQLGQEPSPERQEQIRRELGIEPDDLVVGLVANLNRPVKGVDHFIAAAPAVLQRVPRARFLILGDGYLRPELELQAQRLGIAHRVIFAGFRDDVRDIYSVMQVSTLTSLSEGLSITLLESMSLGLPVVVTRVGGNPELVCDGVSGLLVPPKAPEAFASAVARVLGERELAERLSRGARARAQDFCIKKVAREYADMYSTLV